MVESTKKHILIVDDEPGIVKFLKLRLEIAGFKVATSNSGQGALKYIENEAPDIMLLDIFMPGMNGFEVLRELRKQSNLPVIVLSARSSIADQALSLGANDFIAKPFNPEEVTKRVIATLYGY